MRHITNKEQHHTHAPKNKGIRHEEQQTLNKHGTEYNKQQTQTATTGNAKTTNNSTTTSKQTKRSYTKVNKTTTHNKQQTQTKQAQHE